MEAGAAILQIQMVSISYTIACPWTTPAVAVSDSPSTSRIFLGQTMQTQPRSI